MRSRSPAGAARPESGILSADALERLRNRVAVALSRARPRRGKPLFVSVSEQITAIHDPAAAVWAAREPGDAWFCMEQPERDGTVVAGLGVAGWVSAPPVGNPDDRLANRFERVQDQWRELNEHALCDPPAGPQGTGLIAAGGFAFAPDGGQGPAWDGFASASLAIPQLSLCRAAGETWLTVAHSVQPGDTAELVLEQITRRLSRLVPATLPLHDPSPVGRFVVHSPMAPSHYEEAVARAVERIARGQIQKVVLAREVVVDAPTPHDPGAIFGALRDSFPSCFIYAVGRGETTFIGATPELLVRKDGQRASTVALAGTTRRSGDATLDAHLGAELLRSNKNLHENSIVTKRIASALNPYSVWVTVAPEPVLIKVANVQHLAVPIRAQLRSGTGVLELAGALHPTPAVGGEPSSEAQQLIPALEGFDRGWYAGTVGWVDASGDGEFCVALRCALLNGRHASCFAGAGIVADSDPASELAETELKLQALLPILAA